VPRAALRARSRPSQNPVFCGDFGWLELSAGLTRTNVDDHPLHAVRRELGAGRACASAHTADTPSPNTSVALVFVLVVRALWYFCGGYEHVHSTLPTGAGIPFPRSKR
jgi:hypothetical protein